MAKKNKLEQVLEYLVAGNEAKAKDLLHQVFIEKARAIHESLVDETNYDDYDANDDSEDHSEVVRQFFDLANEDELRNFVKAKSSTGIMTDALTDAEWDMINNALPPGTDFWEWEEEQNDNGLDVISAVEQLIGQKTLVSKIHDFADRHDVDLEDMMYWPEISDRLGFSESDDAGELDMDADADIADADIDMGDAEDDLDDAMSDVDNADMDDDVMGNIESTMGDLESALADLKAEFEKLEGGSADADMGDDMDDTDMDDDMGSEEDAEGEEEMDEMFTEEDFDDLAEAVELEKVVVPTSGEVGAGKYSPRDTNEKSKSPVPPTQTSRFGAKPIKTGDGPKADGYARQAAPTSGKLPIEAKGNQRKKATDGMSNEQSGRYGAKEDSRSALDTTDRTFGKGNQTSPLTHAPRK
jgi:hypothetical protein